MKRPEGKRKKLWLAVLIVLLILAAAAVGIWFWQKNNIEAVIQYTKYSQEELQSKLDENDEKVTQVLDAAITNAQKVDQAQKPSATKPEQPKEETPVQEAAEPEQAPPEPSGPTYEELLQAIVDKVYALRDEYVAALENMEKEAVAAYRALPAEKRNAKGKIEFASSYITKATELEKECDARMDEIVVELTELQRTYGQSLELVETMKYTYAQEKSLKKAWYMSELERRGMI